MSGDEFPSDRKYRLKTHNWYRISNNEIYVGITDVPLRGNLEVVYIHLHSSWYFGLKEGDIVEQKKVIGTVFIKEEGVVPSVWVPST